MIASSTPPLGFGFFRSELHHGLPLTQELLQVAKLLQKLGFRFRYTSRFVRVILAGAMQFLAASFQLHRMILEFRVSGLGPFL